MVATVRRVVQGELEDVRTERLELRRMRPGDLEALAAVFAKPEVWKYPYGRGLTKKETAAFLDAQMAAWASTGFGLWTTVERATGAVVGYIGLSVPTAVPEILPAIEVGWRLDPLVWGQGYATEGATAALDRAFSTLGLSEVCCIVQVDNTASGRVAERLGLRRARSLVIPPDASRGAVQATLFVIRAAEWSLRPGATPSPSTPRRPRPP